MTGNIFSEQQNKRGHVQVKTGDRDTQTKSENKDAENEVKAEKLADETTQVEEGNRLLASAKCQNLWIPDVT